MEKITSGRHEFEIVDAVPFGGYEIWNIGEHMIDGYLPLVQTGGEDDCQVVVRTMKAIKVDEAQLILAAIGADNETVKKMENFIEKFKNSKDPWTLDKVQKSQIALPIMKKIKGIERLKG